MPTRTPASSLLSPLPLLLLLLLLLLLHLPTITNSCTVFLAGKNATTDGSILISHSNDGDFETDPRLVKIPAATHPPDSLRPVFFSPESYPRYVGTDRGTIPAYDPSTIVSDDTGDSEAPQPFIPMGYIPQVSQTYAYLEQTYGAINSQNVGIGESTCSAIFGSLPLNHPNGTALFSIDELTHVAMERSSSARMAISIMGELAETYGFYGEGSFEGEGESLAVSDDEEAWVFHVLPDPTGRSAIWAAERLEEGHFGVLANMFVIRGVDPNDEERFMMSESVHEVARERGWWHPDDGTLLDFTATYSDGEYSHKFYSGRRMWGAYRLAAPSLEIPVDYDNLLTEAVYPFSVKPDELLSVEDFFAMHRDTYEGTQFDLGMEGNLAGGPFGSPDRFKEGENEASVGGNWERSIGLYRTSDTHVVQTRTGVSDPLGGILWFGPSCSMGTVFTPFFVQMSDIPKSFQGHQLKFDRTTMFWAAVYAHNIANMKYSYAIQDVRKRQHRLESNSLKMIQNIADQMQLSTGDSDTATTLTLEQVDQMFMDNAADIVASLWALSDELMFKYADGYINNGPGDMSNRVGYPKWWLEAVGFRDGPPPPPPTNKNRPLERAMVGSSGKAILKSYLKYNMEKRFTKMMNRFAFTAFLQEFVGFG